MARAGDAGVTLIEVLVSLALFSLIAVSGFSVLDSILRVGSGTEGRLERLAEIDTALLLVSRDLQSKGPAALVWDGTTLGFARGEVPLSYKAEGNILFRRTPGDVRQAVLSEVETFSVRVLDDRGKWHDAWPPTVRRVIGVPPRLAGIEISLKLEEGGVTRLVDLPGAAVP